MDQLPVPSTQEGENWLELHRMGVNIPVDKGLRLIEEGVILEDVLEEEQD